VTWFYLCDVKCLILLNNIFILFLFDVIFRCLIADEVSNLKQLLKL